jgi:hypothetical protein
MRNTTDVENQKNELARFDKILESCPDSKLRTQGVDWMEPFEFEV